MLPIPCRHPSSEITITWRQRTRIKGAHAHATVSRHEVSMKSYRDRRLMRFLNGIATNRTRGFLARAMEDRRRNLVETVQCPHALYVLYELLRLEERSKCSLVRFACKCRPPPKIRGGLFAHLPCEHNHYPLRLQITASSGYI